ncbi:CopG family transcriptional regulator [Salinarimonas sp.]|uniref:ribbon-helix-helix domain-containing protein n=1 Tax=Salinarimonas sp. TaxID=2766526 RepID=UPI0032D8E5E9
MRVELDLPVETIAALDALARERGTTREALIREAIARVIAGRPKPRPLDEAFGIWGPGEPDGLACQQLLRDEW